MSTRKMMNNNLFCEDYSTDVSASKTGFESVKTDKFKYLKVVFSEEEDIKNGDVLKVPVHAGNDTEEDGKKYTVLHRRDIIYIE